MMTDFDRVKFYYDKRWASKEQVAQYTKYGVITPAQYKEITGEDYKAPA